jgi:4-amino-4-deoxy-L-arabinose transferase-like glycosyltransferase
MTEGQVLAVRVIVVGLGVPIVAWLFGSSILGRLTNFDRSERFAASFGVSIGFIAVAQFLGFLLNAPQPYYSAGVIFFMLALALLCQVTVPTKKTLDWLPPWPLALLFFLGYLHLFCIQALLPAYRGSYWYFDWWMHYDEALIFVHRNGVTTEWANGYTVASRTPLFNLSTAFALGLTGGEFETYQMASVLPSCSFILALFLLLREMFGPRAAWLALLLAPLNLWMLHNAWFTWPKMLAAYFIGLALYFYLRSLRMRLEAPARSSEYFIAFGFCAVLGFLTHQVALVYCVPLLLHVALTIFVDRVRRPRVAELLSCLLFAVLLVGPWYAWLAGNLGKDKILGSTPLTKGDESARFNPLAAAEWMSYNLRVSFDPVGIREAIYPQFDAVELHRGFTQLYFSLFTGALTLSLTVFLICFGLYPLIREYRLWGTKIAESKPNRLSAWLAVFLFLEMGTLGGAFLHPGHIPWGIAHSAVFPSAVILAALGWGVLSLASPRIRVLVVLGMAGEFLLMFWLHWWLLFHDPEILEPDAGARGIRATSVCFLNEGLGNADIVFLVGAIVVQAILVALLVIVASRNRRVVEEIG